jgi:hypothetical protein
MLDWVLDRQGATLIVAMADWVDGGPWLVRWERRVRRHGAKSLQPGARALLGFRQHLHSLLVLRRELLPLQLERRQKPLE